MKVLDLIQGSQAWKAARAKHFCASEAPAMMGASKYLTRTGLLRAKALGEVEDVDAETQALFDRGHAAEAAMRPLVAEKLGAALPAIVGTDDDGYLLASFDGLAGATGWEHKLWGEDLAMQVRTKQLTPHYYWQLEQQILVGGLRRVIFTCSDGTPERCVHMEYKPVPGRAEQLLAGWKQFEADLANYQHVEHIPAVATATMALPALSIQVQGSISLIDNLKVFGEKLTAFVGNINREPQDDQDFADLEATVKTLQIAQDALEAAESSALAQTASIDEMRRTVAMYKDMAKSNRLMCEKLVKAKKDSLRASIIGEGVMAYNEHFNALNTRLGGSYMPQEPRPAFGEVIKNKRTIASLRDAVSTELARAKIEANAIADRIQMNMQAMPAQYAFLFADAAALFLKAPDDFAAVVANRIAQHAATEQKRLEVERERIRAEEAAKLVRPSEMVDRPSTKPAPIPQPTAWGLPPKRPSDDKLLFTAANAVSQEFGVTFDQAVEWLRELDYVAA